MKTTTRQGQAWASLLIALAALLGSCGEKSPLADYEAASDTILLGEDQSISLQDYLLHNMLTDLDELQSQGNYGKMEALIDSVAGLIAADDTLNRAVIDSYWGMLYYWSPGAKEKMFVSLEKAIRAFQARNGRFPQPEYMEIYLFDHCWNLSKRSSKDDKAAFLAAVGEAESTLQLANSLGYRRSSAVLKTYAALGNAYFNLEQWAKAEGFLNKGISVWLSSPLSRVEEQGQPLLIEEGIYLYNRLGAFMESKGRLREALDSYTIARNYVESYPGQCNPRMVSTVYYNYAIVPTYMGDIDSALYFYEKSLEMKTKLKDASRKESFTTETADIYNSLAEEFFKQRNFDNTRLTLEKSLRVMEEGGFADDPRNCAAWNNLGDLHTEQQQFQQANKAFSKSLSLLKGKESSLAYNKDLPDTYLRWGKSYIRQQRFADADLCFDRADQYHRRFADEVGPALQAKLGAAQAELYLAQGDTLRAIRFARQAKDTYATELTPGDAERGEAPLLMARCYFGQRDTFLAYANEAIDFCTYGQGHHAVSDSHFESSIRHPFVLLNALKMTAEHWEASPQPQDWGKADAYWHSAQTLLAAVRKNYTTEQAKLDFAKLAQQIHSARISLQWRLQAAGIAPKGPSPIEVAFEAAELSTATALLDAVRELKASASLGVPDSILRKERYLRAELFFSIQEQTKDTAAQSKKAHQSHAQGEGYRQLLAEIQDKYPKYYELKFGITPHSIADVQSVLKEGEHLLAYASGKDELFVFALSKTDASWQRCGSLASIKAHVDSLRPMLSAPKGDAGTFQRHAHALYQLLLQPVLANTDARHLIIIGSAPLHQLPFEALVASPIPQPSFTKLDYLIRHASVSYQFSASLYAEPQPKAQAKARTQYAGFAPSYPAGSNLPVLQYAKAEVQETQSLMADGRLWLDEQATRAAFMEACRSHQIVHVAGHALLNDTLPLNSCLVLAGNAPNTNEELSAKDIYASTVNAELICLSACNSGSGNVQEGEGVMSLARSFAYAGCPNIVMTAWVISDKSAQGIVQQFFKQLREGDSKAGAMQKAQADYIRKADSQTAHPYYWAAFSLVGNHEAIQLDNGTGTWWLPIVGGASLAMLLLFFAKNRRRAA